MQAVGSTLCVAHSPTLSLPASHSPWPHHTHPSHPRLTTFTAKTIPYPMHPLPQSPHRPCHCAGIRFWGQGLVYDNVFRGLGSAEIGELAVESGLPCCRLRVHCCSCLGGCCVISLCDYRTSRPPVWSLPTAQLVLGFLTCWPDPYAYPQPCHTHPHAGYQVDLKLPHLINLNEDPNTPEVPSYLSLLPDRRHKRVGNCCVVRLFVPSSASTLRGLVSGVWEDWGLRVVKCSKT